MGRVVTKHVDDLLSSTTSDRHGRDPLISQSWRRCLDEYRLDPVAPRRAYIHTNQRLREHRDAMDDLIRVARFGVETLYRQVSGLGYVLILSDAKGVAVDFMGDPAHDEALRRAGLYRGSDWSERLAGTCAVGTCIITGEALTVHLDDHFAGDHISLTCTAAPIYASDGSLVAVLDISALRSPIPKTSQFLALDTVRSFAHRIETASLHNTFRRDWIIHLSRSMEFADIEPDLAIAVDADGRIVGFNSQARHLLDRVLRVATGPRGPGTHEGLGLRLEHIFATSIDNLPELTRQKPVAQRVLQARDGEIFFALALEPAKPMRPRSAPLLSGSAVPPEPSSAGISSASLIRKTADPAIESLLGFDKDSGGNAALSAAFDRAAASLRVGLPVLIEGETGTGKEPLARALHRMVASTDDPFLKIDCAAFVDPYYEHALFGVGSSGSFEVSAGATLFLDGLNALPLAIQSRLVELLEPASADVRARPARVISTIREDLSPEVAKELFRPDLYYRLKGATLKLPPIRDRANLPDLIVRAHRAIASSTELSAEAFAKLLAHRWPGNIRELEQVLRVAAASCHANMIRAADIDIPALQTNAVSDGTTKKGTLEDAERATILQHLQSHDFDIAKAAASLSMSRATMYRKIKRHGL